MRFNIKSEERIIFQGDDITNGGRNPFNNKDLGLSYPELVSSYINRIYPLYDVKYFNKALWGSTVSTLRSHWNKGCLSLEPTTLSILIGINDIKNQFQMDIPINYKKLQYNYEYLLIKAKHNYPRIKIILMPPFLIPITEEQKSWLKELNDFVEMVAKLSLRYRAMYIPLNKVFKEALIYNPDPYHWTLDGIHLTPSGDALIAKYWLRGFNIYNNY